MPFSKVGKGWKFSVIEEEHVALRDVGVLENRLGLHTDNVYFNIIRNLI